MDREPGSSLYTYLHIITRPPATGCALIHPTPPLQTLTQTCLSHPILVAFNYNKYPGVWAELVAEGLQAPNGWCQPAIGRGGKFLPKHPKQKRTGFLFMERHLGHRKGTEASCFTFGFSFACFEIF